MEPSLFLNELDLSKVRIVGKPPYGFTPAQHGAGREVSGAAAKRKTSSDGRWQLGDRVFNEDRGYGEITAIDEEDEGPVITVQYENGRRQRFLSRSMSSRFMKIRE
jgi:DNA helicase-2/ATP-dependent DNA helicase PcrA